MTFVFELDLDSFKLKQHAKYNQAQSEYKHSLIFCVRRCCHSNETRAPIANPPNNAQLESTPTIPPSYIRVRAVVWECCKDGRDQYTFRLGYASREM